MIDDPARSAGGTLGEYSYGPRDRNNERPMSEVVKDIIANVQEMLRSELRLAKVELRQETAKTMAAGKLLGMAAGLGFFAACFILTSLALILALFMPAWVATLALGVIMGGIAAILFAKGRSNLSVPKPQKTIENVKENVEWMKNQTR
jgi:uncharacterized membrane protein YqjE